MELCLTSWFRNAAMAKPPSAFFRRLPTGLHYVPRVTVTNKLRSHGVAKNISCCRMSDTGKADI